MSLFQPAGMPPQQAGAPQMPPQGMPPPPRRMPRRQESPGEEAVVRDMALMLQEPEDRIDEMGKFASTARMVLEDTEDSQALQSEIISEALDKGFVTEKEARQISRLPKDRFKSALDFKIMQLAKVKNHKMANLQEEEEEEEFNIPTSSVKSGIQKEILGKEQILNQLQPLREGYKSKYFTYKGQAGLLASKAAEKTKGIPGVESLVDSAAKQLTGLSGKERTKFIKDSTGYLNSVEQMFQSYRKQVTGAQASVAEIKMLRDIFLNKDMSPSEFQGALSQLVDKVEGESGFKKEVLRKGIDIAPKIERTRARYRQKGWSDDEIDSALKAQGIGE